MTNAANPHTALRTLLTILAVLLAAGSLMLLLASPWVLERLGAWTGLGPGIIDFLLRGRLAHNDALMNVLLQAIGAFALCFSYAMFAASRDPVRYIAVVDAVIGLLVIVTVVDALSIGALADGNALLAAFGWGRVAIRLIVAAVLLALRPRTPVS